MKGKRILLLGGNYYPEPTGIGKYNGELIEWLSGAGYECGVITTFPYYPFWKIQSPYVSRSGWYKLEKRGVFDGVPVKIYRCPHYVPDIPCGKKRILSDLSFFISAFFQIFILLFQKKYDCVIAVAPPFQIGLLGWFYKVLKNSQLLYHVQDLQVDAAFELGMIKSKMLVRIMFGLERFILQRADYVSSISEGMIRKLKEKCNRHVILFPNWTDTKAFYPISQKSVLKRQFHFSKHDKIVLYSGAIGEKQGLQALLKTAAELRFRKEIKFVICGSGPYKEKLIEESNAMGLSNVVFMPLQSREKFNRFLNIADVHLVLQKANANDLVMPSKLTNILSVGGLAIITAEPRTSLYTVVRTHQMGLLIEPDNQTILTSTIALAVDKTYAGIKENARNYAEEHLTIDKVISKFFGEIMNESIMVPTSKKAPKSFALTVKRKLNTIK